MGIIFTAVIVVILAIVVVGAVAYNNPQKTKVWATKGLKSFVPELIEIKPEEIVDDFKDKLPENMKEIIDKNPSEEKDFKYELPFSDKIPKKEILGRPKKVVEFFCTSDSQCRNYFLKSNAQCEAESGMCFIST